MKKSIKFLSLMLASIISPTIISSCSVDSGFYMANFESYINDDLLSKLESNTVTTTIENEKVTISNFNFRTFQTNETLEKSFSTDYDVAIQSTYLTAKLANEGKLMTINWSKFNLYKLDKNGMQTTELVKDAYDALTLFTPQARTMLLAYDLSNAYAISAKYNESYNQAGGLLNYCVPYFLQDLKFSYKSKTTNSWDSSSSNTYSWNELFNKIQYEANKGNIKKIASIDDYRTIYSASRLIQTNGQTVNPGSPETSSQLKSYITPNSINDYEETFKKFNDNLPKNTFYLNSDSNNVLNDFASLNGSNAILSYNGDVLYSIQGGDNYAFDKDNPSAFLNWIKLNNNTYLAKLKNSFYLLDAMVINRARVSKSELKLKESYAVIKKLILEGIDQSLYTDNTKTKYNTTTGISKIDEDGNFIYWPIINFSYVQYNSASLTLNAYVLNSSKNINQFNVKDYTGLENVDTTKQSNNTTNDIGTLYDSLRGDSATEQNITENSFFNRIYEKEYWDNNFDKYKKYEDYINLLISTYQISNKIDINNIATNLSDLNKSNMSWAYSIVQSKYF